MYKALYACIILLLCCFSLEGATRPSHVPQEIWEEINLYVMPDDHPIKSKLDMLFSKSRVLQNSDSLKAAGFSSTKPRQFSHAIVSKNSKIKHYYFKMFTDNFYQQDDWRQWVTRIVGAKMIQDSIIAHGYENVFIVPQKWIYILPQTPFPTSNASGNYYILVAKDVSVFKDGANKARWKSNAVTKKTLDALYTILSEQGLNDSVYPFNIPFNKYGYISFIDTEHHHNGYVPFHKLTPYLSSKNRTYWESLISNGGPK